ncbi:hypothetical protein VCRA2120E57_700013 [Vibrio crassostreae]|nr:hypothetical protein VCRA2120E57_700013 [Vibrio crassostreae]
MQDIIKKLSNKRQANVFFKDTELTQLTRIIETLQSVKEEKELNAQIEAEAEEKEHQELEAIRTQILEGKESFRFLTFKVLVTNYGEPDILEEARCNICSEGQEVWFTSKNGEEIAGKPVELISMWDSTFRNNDRPDYEPEKSKMD